MLLALVAIIMPIGAWAFYEPESVPINIGTSGVATLYYGAHNLEIPEGVSASVITGVEVNEDGTVTTVTDEDVITEIIPAGCAVILSGTPGEYDFGIHEGELNVPAPSDNLLLGSDEETTIGEEGYLYFYLPEDSESSDWIYVGNDVDNQAHKAYLALPVEEYSELAEMLETLDNPHLQHTHGGCEICGQVTVIEAAWGASADALTSYGKLADAVAAAGEENSNIGYIKLLADVEDDIYVEAGTFTLDLNGHTISSESHTLVIRNQSNVIIVDNPETKSGKVISSGEGSFAVGITNSASVTINGGTYESTHLYALNLEVNSSATINGGSYVNSYLPVQIDEGCSATITGGTFEYTGASAIENYGNLVVEGGTFTYDGDVDPDSYYTAISHNGGSIDLSNCPTDAINSIDVTNNSGEDITPGAETILLPEGYCFFGYSDGTPVTVLVDGGFYYIDVEPAKYAVTFEANGGDGEMEGDNIYEGVDYTLPKCTFGAPEGMMFKAWQIGDVEYQPGNVVTIEDNTTITALWTEFVSQIVIKMHDCCEDGWHGDAIVVKKNGEEIGTATLEIEDGADGIVRYDYDNTAEYTFYWQYTEQDYRCPNECSFEIFIEGEVVFAAVRDDEENTSDCETYENGELIYTIEGEAQVVESLTIVDGELTEYKNYVSTTVGTLTYTRTLPNLMWNALYVPFEIPLSELADNYDVAYINDIRSYDNDENGEIDDMTMEIIRINSGTLNANHPYLIRAKNEEAQNMEIVLSDATLYRTEENSFSCSSMYMEFTITGTYNTLSYEDLEEKYAISTSGAWQKLSVGSSLKPFRLYMEMTPRDGSPVKVEAAALSRIRINMQGEDGNTTGVEILEAPQSINDAVLYDLYGRKVTTPVKGGIYISNGKKVIVK